MVALKDLMAALGSPNVDCRQDGAKLEAGAPRRLSLQCRHPRHRPGRCHPAGRHQPALGIAGAERAPPQALPVGPLRHRQRRPAVDLTYPVERLGAGPATLRELADGKLGFAEKLKAAKNPLIIVGMGALAREDGAAVLALARSLAVVRDDWNGFAVLHTAASRVGGLDLGLVPGEGGRDVAGILAGAQTKEIEVVYLLAPTRSTPRSSARPS